MPTTWYRGGKGWGTDPALADRDENGEIVASTTMPSQGEEIRRVKPAESMTDEVFLKHMNKAHLTGGMDVVGKSNIPGDEGEALLRRYHAKVHELGTEASGGHTRVLDHEHVQPRSE